jgi:pimeloyl-ACP methyl ester carboxylesterase
VTTFVLVPGACHGGWWYEPLVQALARSGHRAVALTLSGLGPDDDPQRVVTLDTHVQEAAEAVADTGQRATVLVGHSYGGSVITGTADQLPEHILALVYLDAFVPEDGDSCYSMTNEEQRRWYIIGAGETGMAVAPLPFFDQRARPHPLATLIQRSRLTGAWRSVAVKHYVAALDWPGESPFAPVTERLRHTPGWQVHEWQTRHNVLHDGPARVLELLLGIADKLQR